MESVVFEDSPLADYLQGEGRDDPHDRARQDDEAPSSGSSSPSFAPRGRPTVRPRFRNKLPPPLHLAIPRNPTVAAIHNTCSKAVNSRLGRVDNARFLDRFRYLIVASQLLSTHTFLGPAAQQSRDASLPEPDAPQLGNLTLTGTAITATFAFALAWMIHWTRGGVAGSGKGRVALLLVIIGLLAVVFYASMRRQWLQYLRQQALAEVSQLISSAQEFDVAAGGALTLVQEVELVSRGYRLQVTRNRMDIGGLADDSDRSTPLPPISRLEDRSQTRRCARLRKALRVSFTDVLPRYTQACAVLKPFTEELDLEKYYDIYDISDADYREATIGYSETEFEDMESLRVLKILAARFHITRKILLCCLMALDAHGGKPDFSRWGTAVDEMHGVAAVTRAAEGRLRQILSEEESFPVPATPKIPLTPGRERWRAQLRKLNTLSSGIRGLQAKLHVLRDESDKALNESEDVSELGTTLMVQYESIGIDLKSLMQEWEDGKAALASNIDRNERRISSMSGMLSPTTSLGGRTAVEEAGTALDALRALNGEEARSRSSMDFSCSSNDDAEEVFEAVALPRQRSVLTREERIAKMREERSKRESVKDRRDANTHMLRELESVINMRPRTRTAPGGRITSI